MTYGYIRVSSIDQNEDRQLDAMAALSIPTSHIFTDKLSGKDTKRPALQSLLSAVKKGDTIVVESISRFARNTKDLLVLVERLSGKGVEFVSLKEYIDTTTPTGRFTLTVFAAIAELERENIRARQAEGIAAARARGVHMGRPAKRLPENFVELARQWQRGKLTTTELMRQTDMTETTLYRRLREHRLVRMK